MSKTSGQHRRNCQKKKTRIIYASLVWANTESRLEAERVIGGSLRKVGSESSRLWLKLLGAIWFDTKSDRGRRSGLLWRQRSGCWLLGNWRHWGRRCIGLVAVAIDTSGLRLQCRRENGVDTSLHWLLELPVSTKACGLRPKSLEPSLLRDHTTKRLLLLLLLLDTEL